MSQAAVASPAQADTTQFDLSSAVSETEDGKAVSAMPAFDLSSAVPEDQLSKVTPQYLNESIGEAHPEKNLPEEQAAPLRQEAFDTMKKGLNNIPDSPLSKAVRWWISNIGRGGLEEFKEADYDYSHIQAEPTRNEGESDESFNKRFEAFRQPLEEAEISKGVMGQLNDTFTGAIAMAAPEMNVAAWAKLGTFMAADTTRRAVQNILAPNMSASGKDLMDIVSFFPEAGLSHVAVEGLGEMFSNAFKAKGQLPVVDLPPEHVAAIAGSGISDEAKADLMGRLGVTQAHVDASIATGKPIRVPIVNLMDMAESPHWGDIVKNMAEDKATTENIETPQAKAIEEELAQTGEELSQENPRARPKEQPEWTDDEKSRMGELRDIVSGWKAGGQLAPGNAENGRMIRLPSSFGISDQGLTQRDLTKLFDRFESGKPLTNKQIRVTKMLLDYHKGSENLEGDITNATNDVSESEAREAQETANQEEPVVQPALDQAWADEGEGEEKVEPPISPMTGGLQEETGKFGEHNTLFTEAMANEAREAFNKKTSGLHSGIDPTAIGDLLKIGGYHFEGGVREFGAWSEKMINDLGEKVKPYLQDVWDKLQKQSPQMAQPKVEATDDELAKQKYFPLEKLGIKKIVNTKTGEVDLNASGKDMRERYLGTMNERTQRVFDLADDIRGLEKDKGQQEGQFINAGFNGDTAKIQEWITKLDAEVKDEDREYWEKVVKPAAEQALNLSEGAKEGIGLGNQYFKESGLAMKSVGAIRTFLENYGINRLYEPDSAEKVLKGSEYDNPQQATGYAKQRVFDNPLEAVLYGKRFKTMNYPDLIGIHGEEAAAVTTGRQFVQEAVPEELSAWTDRSKVPAGWSQVGNMERDIPMKDQKTGELILDKEGNQDIKHQVLVAPKAIADIMGVITDPDNLKKVSAYRKAQAVNNFTKSFNVMIGLFHDRNFIEQKLFSPGGIKALANTFGGQLKSLMAKDDWKNERLLFLKHGGMTGSLSTNIDVLKPDDGTEGQNWLKKVEKMPIIKQATALVEWHRNNLFDVMGQYYKVDSFALRRAQWDLKNPEATDDERTEAYRGFARASNNDYGGQSWFARGFNRTTMSVARLFAFAPDWLYSAFRTAKTAAIDWKGIAGSQGTEGGAARALLIKQFVYATAATQAANYAITGHFTDKNTKGNQWTVEINKNIHVSLYAAGLGELVKLCADVGESGWATGLGQYITAKVSPIMRFFGTIYSHTNYHNQDIRNETGGVGAQIAKVVPEEYQEGVAKQVNYVNELTSTIAPVPFVTDPGNVGYIADQVKDAMTGKKPDIAGSTLLLAGAAHYSAGESEERQQQDIDDEVSKGLAKNDMTAANKYLESGDISQDRIDELKSKAEETPLEKSYKNLSVEKIIKKADGNIDGMDADDKQSLKDMLDDKYDRMQSEGRASPNEIKRVGDLLQDFYDKHKIE